MGNRPAKPVSAAKATPASPWPSGSASRPTTASRCCPCPSHTTSRPLGQRTATWASSSTSWHGPICRGRSGRWRPGHLRPVAYPVRLGRYPVAIAMMVSIVTTRMAAANISTSFSMAQSPRWLAPWPSVPLTASCIKAVRWILANPRQSKKNPARHRRDSDGEKHGTRRFDGGSGSKSRDKRIITC